MTISAYFHGLVEWILAIVSNPLSYLYIAISLYDVLRNIRFERRWFGIRVTRVWMPTLRKWLVLLAAGLVLTVLNVQLGAQLTVQTAVALSGLTILVGVINLRFSATPFVLAVGGLVILVGTPLHIPGINQLHASVQQVSVLMLLVGEVYVVQALMVWMFKKTSITPAMLAGRRGKAIGAFKTQFSFLLPIGVWSMAPMHSVLYHTTTMGSLMSLTALPLLFGFHSLTASESPRKISTRLVVFSTLMAVISLCAAILSAKLQIPALAGVGCGLVLILEPLFLILLRHKERYRDPLCTPSHQGVVVLYPVRGTLSERIGLQSGDVITHVNQVAVTNEHELHRAFDRNPTYAKLRVVDRAGEPRVVSSPVYDGERHQLGLIVLPPVAAKDAYKRRVAGLLATIYTRVPNSRIRSQRVPEDKTTSI